MSIINNSSKDKTNRGDLTPFEEARHIGILYTWEGVQKEQAVQNLIEKIQEEREITTLCYNPDKKTIPETNHLVFGVHELSILGKIKSEVADQFLKSRFDYLFHLDFEPSEITGSLLINSKAKCRIGLHVDESEGLYELMIGINKSAGLDNLIEQMLLYVNALK